MLNDTITLNASTTPVDFVRRTQTGTVSNFVPKGDSPNNERKLRVGHEVTKSGTVNTLFAVSHLKSDPAVPTAAPKAAAVQIKMIRPGFVTEAEMKDIISEAISGFGDGDIQDSLLNQEQ